MKESLFKPIEPPKENEAYSSEYLDVVLLKIKKKNNQGKINLVETIDTTQKALGGTSLLQDLFQQSEKWKEKRTCLPLQLKNNEFVLLYIDDTKENNRQVYYFDPLGRKEIPTEIKADVELFLQALDEKKPKSKIQMLNPYNYNLIGDTGETYNTGTAVVFTCERLMQGKNIEDLKWTPQSERVHFLKQRQHQFYIFRENNKEYIEQESKINRENLYIENIKNQHVKNDNFFGTISKYIEERNEKLKEIKDQHTNYVGKWNSNKVEVTYEQVLTAMESFEEKTNEIKIALNSYLNSKNEIEAKEIETSLLKQYNELVTLGTKFPVVMRNAKVFIKDLEHVIDETRAVVRDYQPGDLKTEFSEDIAGGAKLNTIFTDMDKYLGKKRDLKSMIVGSHCQEIKALTEEILKPENSKDKENLFKKLDLAYENLKKEPIIKQHRSPRMAKVVELAGLVGRTAVAVLSVSLTEWGKKEGLGTSMYNFFTKKTKTRSEKHIDKLKEHIEVHRPKKPGQN